MDLTVLGLAFAALVLVELPDKTFLATLVLTTKYRPLPVWCGVGLAFGVQTTVAVLFGQALGLLPARIVQAAAAAMFLGGAIVLWRTARGARRDEAHAESGAGPFEPVSATRALATSFLVLFAAEWGDLSQVLTLTLAARYGEPLEVFLGAWGALLTVSGIAVLVGRSLAGRIRVVVLHYAGATVCLVLAIATAAELARGVV
ncbi:MAG: TMEM165/GDT1 family protein [Nocardioides sp.]